MSASPQPFFSRGPSPLARLTAFGLAALLLMFVDSRFRALDTVRSGIATVVHPLQQAALVPLQLWRSVSTSFESRRDLQIENTALREKALANAATVQGYGSLVRENEQMRILLTLRERASLTGIGAEVIQTGRDPFSQRVFIDRGVQHGIQNGNAAIDGNGVVGQVTRAHPLVSEVTLVTDKDHAIPVQNERTGVRYVMFGLGSEQLPELRFVATTVDVQAGDTLVTSGLDGVYPPALVVAKVAMINREPGQTFLRIRCTPVAGVASSQKVLVLASNTKKIDIPVDPKTEKTKSGASAVGGKK